MNEVVKIDLDSFVKELTDSMLEWYAEESGVPFDSMYEKIDDTEDLYLKEQYLDMYDELEDHIRATIAVHSIEDEDGEPDAESDPTDDPGEDY